MKARDIMITDIPTISTKSTVMEAVLILCRSFGGECGENSAPGLVVVHEDGTFAGILSPLTIIRAFCEHAATLGTGERGEREFFDAVCTALKERRVEQIMDWQAISVTENADIIDVAELFVKHRFQRVPVVDRQKVVGLIFRSRLMAAITSSLVG